MVKKCLAIVAALCLLLSALPLCGQAELTLTPLEGEDYYPDKENWTYHYLYSYPQVEPSDVAAILINDTYATALSEMRELVLPMFAASQEMTAGGQQTVIQDFTVTCNNGTFFSVLMRKQELQGEKAHYSLESDTFDVQGEYIGETLTLRGVTKVGDSSEQLAQAVLPELYKEFSALQAQGVCDASLTEEDFFKLCVPTLDFYADEEGNAVFYLQPSLLTEPKLDVPVFVYTPEALAALLK